MTLRHVEAIRDLPIGVAYVVWTGLGTLGVVHISALWLREGLNLLQILCVIAIGGGIVGLKKPPPNRRRWLFSLRTFWCLTLSAEP
jgi:hypothetical protein